MMIIGSDDGDLVEKLLTSVDIRMIDDDDDGD